jgi:hypothetical protein
VVHAKGGEIKGQSNWISRWINQPLVILKNSRVRIFFFAQMSFIAKFGPLWGRILIMGKRGSF